MDVGGLFPDRSPSLRRNLLPRPMIPLSKVFGSVSERCCRWLDIWPQGRPHSKRLAMNAPLLPKETWALAPVRAAPSLTRQPPRAWKNLSEVQQRQVASIVAEMVKRMAAESTEGRSDAGDPDI